jgi:predicted RNase H-like HicB family nuclease
MKKIVMMVERSKDFFDAYSDNCDGIYAAGNSIDEVKADAEKAIALIKQNLPRANGLMR